MAWPMKTGDKLKDFQQDRLRHLLEKTSFTLEGSKLAPSKDKVVKLGSYMRKRKKKA